MGGYSRDGYANGNIVTINGTMSISAGMENTINGGYSLDGEAHNNVVNIMNSGTISGYVQGGSGRVTYNNTINISGGTINGNVFGGYSIYGTATNNVVELSGGTIDGAVYGGYSKEGFRVASRATGNTVILKDNPNIANADLYGGYSIVSSANVVSGNTLHVVAGATNFTAKSVQNFEYYTFQIPALYSGSGPLLTITDTPNFDKSSIKLFLNGGDLTQGDSIDLIYSAGLSSLKQNAIYSAKSLSELSIYNLSLSSGTVTATKGADIINPQTKAFSEGRAAGLGFISQGGDMAAGKGMENAVSETNANKSGIAAFGATSYGNSRYESGSHVDVKGTLFIAGLAWKATNTLMIGAFF